MLSLTLSHAVAVLVAISLLVGLAGGASAIGRTTEDRATTPARGYDPLPQLLPNQNGGAARQTAWVPASDARGVGQARFVTARFLAPRAEPPSVIYRGGRPSPSNVRLRQGEEALSFRDSLSNPWIPPSQRPPDWRPVFRPGDDFYAVDATQLPSGSVVADGVPGSITTPPGHVSVYDPQVDLIKEAELRELRGTFPE